MPISSLDEINKQLFIPNEDATTPVKEEEAKAIYNLLKQRNVSKTLEIGFAYGRSASHVLFATGAKHIAIDPFQDKYGNHGVHNIEKLGFQERFELIRKFSHTALPELVQAGQKFEFIFIDGDHKYDGIFIDFYYSDFLIDKGGVLLFHDTWMRSTELVLQFIRTNRKDYRQIPIANKNMALFEKISDVDPRDGMHFREFYNTKTMLRHHATMQVYEQPNGLFAKFIRKIKGILN